uniref:Uncharacterized protein n=1 Tax=Candidozyma auris TaxID=498019 RepID=A0A0L0P0I0_CANAR
MDDILEKKKKKKKIKKEDNKECTEIIENQQLYINDKSLPVFWII